MPEISLANVKALFGGNIRFAITAGSSLPAAIQQFFTDIGIPVIEGYGLTETSPTIATENFGLTKQLQGGMKPIPGVKVVLYEPDTSHRVEKAGEEGEICAIGPAVMMGYHDNEAATNEVIFTTAEGERCLRTGDLGKLTDGVLTITGRCKEQYKLANGKFIMPSKIEEYALKSRYVAQVYVHGANLPSNIALIYPDAFDLLKDLPGNRSFDSVAEMLSEHRSQVEQLIMDDLNRIFFELNTAGYEKIKAIYLLSEPFSVANNMLTQKLSMKRRVIAEVYHVQIEELSSSIKSKLNR